MLEVFKLDYIGFHANLAERMIAEPSTVFAWPCLYSDLPLAKYSPFFNLSTTAVFAADLPKFDLEIRLPQNDSEDHSLTFLINV